MDRKHDDCINVTIFYREQKYCSGSVMCLRYM